MKLFGGKKGDDKQSQGGDDEAGYYDSPQETVSLADARGSAPKGGAPAPKSSASGTIGSGTPPARPGSQAAPTQPQQQQQSRREEHHDDDDARPHYGIDQAILLMRALPVDQNVELVVQVIKTTLESLKVKVPDIIADADRKMKDLEERVSNLKRAIADFEKEIESRKIEIARLDTDHAETSSVRQRLELAEKAQQKVANAPAPATGVKGSVAKTG